MARTRKTKLNISGVPIELNDLLDLVVKAKEINGYGYKVSKSKLIIDLLEAYFQRMAAISGDTAADILLREKLSTYLASTASREETQKNISVNNLNKILSTRHN